MSVIFEMFCLLKNVLLPQLQPQTEDPCRAGRDCKGRSGCGVRVVSIIPLLERTAGRNKDKGRVPQAGSPSNMFSILC